MPNRWYVVATNNTLEQYATEHLEAQGFKVFYPKYRKLITRNRHEFYQDTPFYPGYVFVRFNFRKDRWRSINGTRGVKSIIGASEQYVPPLPKGFVEALRKQTKDGYLSFKRAAELTVVFTPGMAVIVDKGAFKGMVGICQNSSRDRVLVLLSLLSRETRVDLAKNALLPASKHDGESAVAS